MNIGTKSVLFGAHCFLIHPWFVALAWWKLYGFPFDPRLWVAFFVHDLGYVGKPNMDGLEGERHPLLGARIMSMFDKGYPKQRWVANVGILSDPDEPVWEKDGLDYGTWGEFTLLHSRYLAKSLGKQPSRLCAADKLAIALTPAWIYLPMVNATGEIYEYMGRAKHRTVKNTSSEERRQLTSTSQREWYAGVQSYLRKWAIEHRDCKPDTWTSDPKDREILNEAGVWK